MVRCFRKPLALFSVGLYFLSGPVDAARMIGDLSRHEVDSAAQQAAEQAAQQVTKETKGQTCKWGELKCCCSATSSRSHIVSPAAKADVICKRMTTGFIDGTEICKCGDLSQEHLTKLGLDSKPHSQHTWRNVYYSAQLNLVTGSSAMSQESLEDMDAQCEDASLGFASEGERPDGSCTINRVWNFVPQFQKSNLVCNNNLLGQARAVQEKLEASKLLMSFNPQLTSGSLMACQTINGGCASFSPSGSIMTKLLDNLNTGLFSIGSTMRTLLLDYAKEQLMVEAGIDETTASSLLNWAFYHEEGKNEYCDPVKMEAHRDMLVTGLTASEPGHKPDVKPWSYGNEVYDPFKDMLRLCISGMFTSDCEKEDAPEVTWDEARAGKGLKVITTDADGDASQNKKHSVANPLKQFMHIPIIKTTLDYVNNPNVDHAIEANEAELIRESLFTLGALLANESFFGQLTRNGGFDNWDMPPEVEGLWTTVKSAKHGERIWPDSLIEKLKAPAEGDVDCNCADIEPKLGLHMLNQLPHIGLDFGNVRINPSDGKLVSDKETETLEHVDVSEFARSMIAVEAGIQDPLLATKFIAESLQRGAEASGSSSAVPNVSASGKVKGVLVGMPIVQNLWAALHKDLGLSTEVFAKKMKWFFVANIIWAVFHAIEKPLPPEDIVLGLLTVVLATLSSFSYDGQWITFSNSKEFTDYMLAVYTVWNYRFVKQWASNEQPADQWMHVSVALTMPIVQSLVNHDDLTYYINYRRDDLFQSMLMMLHRQLKEGQGDTGGRCCCDWDTDKHLSNLFTKESDMQQMANAQRCTRVPKNMNKWHGRCPAVRTDEWVNIDDEKQRFMDFRSGGEYLQLHHDEHACDDTSKVLRIPPSALR